ncbi:MAG: response regulator [Mycobacterium sp.]
MMSGLRILLVEDNPGDVHLTKRAFRNQSVGLEIADDGDKALARLQNEALDLPHMVLLDLNLPGMSGAEVLKAIRADPRLSRLPVVILTSSKAAEDLARVYDARTNAYLAKPRELAQYEEMATAIDAFWRRWNIYPPPRAKKD